MKELDMSFEQVRDTDAIAVLSPELIAKLCSRIDQLERDAKKTEASMEMVKTILARNTAEINKFKQKESKPALADPKSEKEPSVFRYQLYYKSPATLAQV